MKKYISLVRVKQWVKNLFVFAPLFFSLKIFDYAFSLKAIACFIFFSAAASAVYIVNDIKDIEKDKTHPKKKNRPLASGEIPVRFAYVIVFLIYVFLLTSAFLSYKILFILFSYIIINYFYSVSLKNVPVVDIFTIAFGFILRVLAGSLVIEEEVSAWMLITTLCLALYLASIKRRQEIINVGNSSRKVLIGYSIDLIDKYASISSTGALVFYSLFVVTAKMQLAFSVPFVIFGIFRYWYLVEMENEGESPTDLVLSDGILIINTFLWIFVSVLCLVYGG